MKRITGWSVSLAAAVSFSYAAAATAVLPADITGRWLTQTEVQGIAVNETCDVVQAKDGSLTGSCETSGGIFKLTGKVTGTAVNLSHPAAYQGQDSTVSFFGKLDDDTTISGSLDLQPLNAGGSFAMKKQTAK